MYKAKPRTTEDAPIKFQTEHYKKKVQGVEIFVKQNFNMPLERFIQDGGWKENADLCINVVNDKLTVEDQNYLNKMLGGLSHLKDRRSPPEYALDLILGWVMEDAILKILEELGLKCALSSADKRREFLKRPKASPDIKIKTKSGQAVLLELVKDFKGYWRSKQKIDLRDAKYNNLKKESGILLGLDFVNRQFFVLPIAETKADYIERHYPYGGKPAYSISLKEVTFHNITTMKQVLKEFFEK